MRREAVLSGDSKRRSRTMNEQQDHRSLGASEDDPSVWRKTAGKVNAEIA